MYLKQALVQAISQAVNIKTAGGDFYTDMLARSDSFYNKALPVQENIMPKVQAPSAKKLIGRAAVPALLAGAGGLYLASRLREINKKINPGE
jgi:hypothetical protein